MNSLKLGMVSSFDEKYEVLRWKYGAMFNIKADVWMHEALINPFSKFFHHLQLKTKACFSCHKKMHDDTAELVVNIDNEDISEHKWSSPKDIDRVMVMGEEILEN